MCFLMTLKYLSIIIWVKNTTLSLGMVKLSHTEACVIFMSHQAEEGRESCSGLLPSLLVTNPFQKLLFRDVTFKSDSWRSVAP